MWGRKGKYPFSYHFEGLTEDGLVLTRTFGLFSLVSHVNKTHVHVYTILLKSWVALQYLSKIILIFIGFLIMYCVYVILFLNIEYKFNNILFGYQKLNI